MTEFDWVRAQEGQPFPSTEGGATGYFSAPARTLDPALFIGDTLKPSAAHQVLNPLRAFLGGPLGLHKVPTWLRAWIAGSGITYQWQADRGNGDLDVMVGLDRVAFNAANPDLDEVGDAELADWLNTSMKDALWPRTRNASIGGKTFEVTYFYNPGTGDDIANIHPYAAYDLLGLRWVVRPPAETAVESRFPEDFRRRAAEDLDRAGELVKRYGEHYRALQGAPAGSPGHVNAGSQLNLVTAQAHAMLDDIHHGRQIAFQGGGKGYLDWHNFRWQEAKGNGVVKALSEITGVRRRAAEESDADLYGGKVASVDDLLMRAMTQRRTL